MGCFQYFQDPGSSEWFVFQYFQVSGSLEWFVSQYSFARRTFAVDPGLAKSQRNVTSVGLRLLRHMFWPRLPCSGTTVGWPLLHPAVLQSVNIIRVRRVWPLPQSP